MEDKITPRHKILIENRVNFKLRYMLASSDEEFDQRVKAAVERRQRFESGSVAAEASTLSDSEDVATSEAGTSFQSTHLEMAEEDQVLAPKS